jgi:hypothetical protein
MPVLGAITLADGQATPVNQVFTPSDATGNTVLFNDGGDPIASQVTMATTLFIAKKKGQFSVASVLFRIPYLDATTGALLFYDQARVEYRFGYGSLLAKRKNLFAFVKNIQANASFKAYVENLQTWLGS